MKVVNKIGGMRVHFCFLVRRLDFSLVLQLVYSALAVPLHCWGQQNPVLQAVPEIIMLI